MDLQKIIEQHSSKLKECDLKVFVHRFNSPNIRAIQYKGHVGLASHISTREAHEVLSSACSIRMCPVHLADHVISQIKMIHGKEIAVWTLDSFSQSSNNRDIGVDTCGRNHQNGGIHSRQ